jgi:hypothetical protein
LYALTKLDPTLDANKIFHRRSCLREPARSQVVVARALLAWALTQPVEFPR